MKKRVLVTLLAFCLVAALCVVGAAASAPAGLPDADANGVIRLTEDITVSSIPLNETGETVIDLNGQTLTYTGTAAVSAKSGQILTITDTSDTGEGKMVSTGLQSANAFISAESGGIVNASNITVRTENAGSAFFARGDAAAVNINNCEVYGYYYGVGTNSATVDNYNVIFTLENSYFECISSDGDNCPIMINVPGTLIIDGCIIVGDRQAVFVRAGDATITDSQIITTGAYSQADPETWRDGNNVPKGALVVGSQTSNDRAAYKDDANCKIIDTTITSRNDSTPAVYVSSNDSDSLNYVANLNISGTGSAITGDIVVADGKETAASTVVVENGATISGDIANNSAASSVAVINATHNGEVTVDKNSEGTVYVESDTDNNFVALNSRTMKAYESLEDAIAEADADDTIDLVADAAPTDIVRITKSVIISGNGHKIDMTPADGDRGKTLEIGQRGSTNTVTLDGVILNISDTDKGDAIDVWSTLNIVDSTIDIRNVQSGLVLQGGIDAVVNVDNSRITMDELHGNGSNGGTWNISNNSVISISNCVDHGLSTEVLKVEDSTVTISGAGEMAIFAGKLDVLGNSVINVTESGKELPKEGYAGLYNSPVQVKATDGAYLNVDDGAVINLYNNTGRNGANDTIYLPEGSTLTNDGTINATVVVPEESNMNVVTFIVDGKQYDVRVVNDGESTVLPILKRSGYEFHGWRSGNRVFDGGETVPVYNNMTFTALWSMIEIPDTYAISVNSTANGEVDVSLNNASAGSVITITATPDEGYRVGAVTVSGPDGRVDVERVDATTYTFVMPAGGVEIDVSFVEDAALSEPFTDVSEGHWFYEYVAYVYTHGLMEGTSATTFEPDAGMTRAMFWAVLARIDGQSVSGANWLETARAWAMAEGVSDGTAASELVTREQMVTMLYRFAGSPVAGGMALSEFADAGSVSSWASDAMSWALGEGVISGMGGGMLSPQGTATRAQAAAILMRFVEG